MKVLVLGGGLAGLSAAAHAPESADITVLEKQERLGGLLRTDEENGFLFDRGPHLFFHTDPYFIEVFEASLKGAMVRRPARTGQFSFSTLIDFPYALHLKKLPAEVVAKCVSDFTQCRLREARGELERPLNYEQYCRAYFGDGFTDHFMIPYAVKIWTVHPRDLSTEWVGERIVLPDLKNVIEGALIDRSMAGNYIKEFRYPEFGGTQSFVDGFVSERLKGRISVQTRAEVVEISLKKKSVKLADGRVLYYEKMISSLPLPEMAKIASDLSRSAREAADRLDWFGVLLLNFGVEHLRSTPYQWIYYDQQDTCFHRIHYPSKLADRMAPEGRGSIQAEISFSKHRRLAVSPDALLERAWQEMARVELIEKGQVPLAAFAKPVEYAYAIMNHDRRSAVEFLRAELAGHGVITCGRFGEWDYIWTDKVLHSGKRAGETLI